MDENQQCVICHQFNDQMLMLQCVHDPCINCAAIHYAEQFKGKLKNYYYTCQLCGQRTALDISSVIQLEKLAPKKPEDPISIKKPQYRDAIGDSATSLARKDRYDVALGRNEVNNGRENYKEDSRENAKGVNYRQAYDQTPYQEKGYTKKSIKMCKDHGEQEVSYYCFKCFENICPECAIHGVHQGHDVKAIKKAIVDVKKQFGVIIQSINRTQDDLRKNKEHYSRKIKQLNEETNKQKSFVSKQFQTLRSQLMAKQRQYLKELDEINHRNASILATEIDLINKQNQQANKLTRNIEQTLKRDEVSVLEQYGKKNQSYNNEIQKMSVSQVGYSNVPGLKMASLSQLKQSLSSVNSTISETSIKTEDLNYSG